MKHNCMKAREDEKEVLFKSKIFCQIHPGQQRRDREGSKGGAHLPKIVIRNKGALYSFHQCVNYRTGRYLTTRKHLPLNLTWLKQVQKVL